jgi:hypothetical protein
MRRQSPRIDVQDRDDAPIGPIDPEGAIPQHPRHLRPGAVESLKMVNAFADWVFVGQLTTEPRTGRSSAGALARLFVQAWVNNLAYLKRVWADVYLVDESDAVVHAEVFTLGYLEPAGAGGDFFVVDAHVPSKGSGTPLGRPVRLRYRLYFQVGDTLYTDGPIHDHEVPRHELFLQIAPEPDGSASPASPKRRNGPARSPRSRASGEIPAPTTPQ